MTVNYLLETACITSSGSTQLNVARVTFGLSSKDIRRLDLFTSAHLATIHYPLFTTYVHQHELYLSMRPSRPSINKAFSG